MKRIHLLGASGSGVSTLGRNLAQKLEIDFFDADDYFWIKTDPPFRSSHEPAERQRLLREALGPRKNWVISGSMVNWSDQIAGEFTHLIYLSAPRELRLDRLRRREKERHGERIAEGGDMHKAHLEFLAWAEQYEEGRLSGRSLGRHENWLAQQSAPLLRLDSSAAPLALVNTCLEFLDHRGFDERL